MSKFDPYHKWLGIPESQRPVDFYTLLGLSQFEDDRDVISSAADRQMSFIRSRQSGQHGDIAQKILNELSRARRCLLTPEKKEEYDSEIRSSHAAKNPIPMATQPTPKQKPDAAPPVPVIRASGPSKPNPRRVSSMKHKRKKNTGWIWTTAGLALGFISVVGVAMYLVNATSPSAKKKTENTTDVSGQIAKQDKEVNSNKRSNNQRTNKQETSQTTNLASGQPKTNPNNPGSGSNRNLTSPTDRQSTPTGQRPQRPNSRDQAGNSQGGRPGQVTEQGRVIGRSGNTDIVDGNPPNPDNEKIHDDWLRNNSGTLKDSASQPGTALLDVAPVAKIATPERKAIKLATQRIEAAYRDDFAQAKSDIQLQRKLAKTLLNDSVNTQNDPVENYALILQSLEISKQIGDGETAADALLELDRLYDVEKFWKLTRSSIDSAWKQVQAEAQILAMYKGLNKLIRLGIQQKEYVATEFLISKGHLIAKKTRNQLAQDQYDRVESYVDDVKRLSNANQDADKILEASPTTPGANTTRGDYLIFVLQDITAGLKHWAHSDDEERSAIYDAESKIKDDDVDTTISAADAWLALGDRSKTISQQFSLRRSRQLYQNVRFELTGVKKRKVDSAIEFLDSKIWPILPNRDGIFAAEAGSSFNPNVDD